MQRALAAVGNPMVLRFLKDRNSAEIGISEVQSVYRSLQPAALRRKNASHRRTHHRMSHAHDIDPGNALADIFVYALQIGEDSFFPVRPILLQQNLPVRARRAFGQGPVNVQTVRSAKVRSD